MSDRERGMAAVGHVAWGVVLAGVLLRALLTTDPLPYWDSDPTRLSIPLTGLTPGWSNVVDVVIIAASGLALFAQRAVSVPLAALIFIGAIGVFLHAAVLRGGSIENARIGSTWIAAMAAGLAAVHACRDDRTRRLTLAVCIGLIMMLAAKGALQFFVEHPQTVRQYESDPSAFQTAQGWSADSNATRTFERRLRQREASGWFGLSNVYASFAAAALVALTGWAILAAREARSGRLRIAWALLLTVAAGVSAGALWMAGSKGGVTAAGIGLSFLAGRMLLVRRIKVLQGLSSRAGGMLAVALVLSAIAALVFRGVLGEAIGDLSLLFRWFYIKTAAAIFADHWLTGVGPAGFKDAYMLAKPPLSPEEVQSPHSIVFDHISTLGVLGLAWAGVFVAWVYRLGCRIVAPDQPTDHRENPRAERWLAALVIAIPVLIAAWVESPAGTPESALMRVCGLAGWIGATFAAMAAARLGTAWMWGAALAGLTLAVHGQIEVTPVWAGSACLCAVLIAAGGAGVSPPAGKGRGRLIGSLLIGVAAVWTVFAAASVVRWEHALSAAATEVRPLAEVSERIANLASPALSRGDSMPRIAADVASLAGGPVPTDAQSFRVVMARLTAQRCDAAAKLLAESTNDHAATLEAASRMWLMAAASHHELGEPMQAPLDAAAAAIDIALRSPTAAVHGMAANVLSARADLEGRPELAAKAIEHWTAAAALDPYGLTFPFRLFRAEVARGNTQGAKRWAQRLLDLNPLQRLDPLKHLTAKDLEEVEAVLRRP
jgi:hypothetical protein